MSIAIPLTPQQFRSTIIVAGSFSGGGGGTGLAGGPRLLDQAAQPPSPRADSIDIHFDLAVATTVTYYANGKHLQSGGDVVGFRPAIPGPPPGRAQAVYLPFLANNIASAVLPPAGVDCFFTDALSGCAVFVDRAPGGQLVVYHGNAMAHCPNRAAVLANPDVLRADSLDFYGAMNHMAGLHVTAMADRAAALGALTPVAHLQRNTYMACVDAAVARKREQKRTNVDLAGTGTNVMGFLVGGAWQFWWQTWAKLTYTRPENTLKGVFKGREHGIAEPAKLLAAERFA